MKKTKEPPKPKSTYCIGGCDPKNIKMVDSVITMFGVRKSIKINYECLKCKKKI